MMPNAIGGAERLRRRVGILFGVIFLVATIRWGFRDLLLGMSWLAIVADSRFSLVGLISLVFFAGLKFPRIQVVEPYIFLAIAIIPFLESPEAVYGFGLFAVGTILLFVDGQLSRKPILKLSLLGAYFLALLALSTILTQAKLETAIGQFLFMIGFFLFLFLTFQDKIIVFVRAGRPVVRLHKKGLSEKESAHILALIQGKSMKEIASESGLKESTIRNSLSRAYHRLGFTDKTQVLQWAETHDIQP